jgi:hypothetical protein
MKRLLALILACICILSLAACDLDPTSGNPEVDNGSNNGTVISPDQGLTPDGNDMLNSDGTLKIPEPDSSAELTVDASTWQTLLSKDAIRAAMLDNSMTTITSDNNSEQYQMYYCAGGRYGSILVGNYRSETICGLSDGTVYVFKRSAAEGSWTRDTYAGSYEEYVANSYLRGPMQFFSGLDSIYAQATYNEAEKAYIVENFAFSPAADVQMTGKLKVQFAGEKLYSITLYLSNDGVSGAVTTVFGATAAFDLPADFQSGNSGSVSVAPDTDHSEPAESVCSKDRWERLFSENRILDSLVETHGILKIYNGSQEYLFQITHDYSRIVSDTNSGYQELIISHHDRYQRDSKNGQWLYYSGGDHLQQYDTILTEKMDILVELLAEVKDLYDQAHFNSSTKCFLIQDVRFTHNTFGNVIVDYFITFQGGMLEKIEANIRNNNAPTWYLTTEEGEVKDISLPTDYVDMSKDEHGKRP